ncbi:hypothetical protein GGX14DRAFT_438985 [Mycena pura]|uniref:SET domain-containing protein n=1 Tax=Mycena pura TaxID=153505 RepID=A0AAD6VR73_9AGAR|nr:hypothetical protein GGX14DRAFT_438985 [Mycena pura]
MSSLSYVPGNVLWRPTKIMNMRDLSKDDDFLSHLLVEKLGTGTVPLLVHKMDSSRRLPKTHAEDILKIVRRLVTTKGPISLVIRQAVDELLVLSAVRYYLKHYTQKQINAFATHASRYFELYHPSGCIEIAHTSRYAHHTGKSELCILATRNLAPGSVITELKGSMANLTDEEDRELKRTDLRNSDIRRDFSVIHSKQMKKNHLFLGPARFVNHDCNNNCELFREGKYITFRVLRPIAIGEEISAHYGDGYFGKKNRHCLCETCEKRGKGGYAPDHTDEDPPISSDSETDSDSDSDLDSDENLHSDGEAQKPRLNLNERRTRRGVYAIMPEAEEDTDESDNEADDVAPVSLPEGVIGGEIELVAEVDTASDLTSLPPSRAQSNSAAQPVAGPSSLPTPESPGMASPEPSALTALSPAMTTRSSSALTSLSSTDDRPSTSKNRQPTPFRSIISTRDQRAQARATPAAELSKQLMTPPLSEDPDTPTKRFMRSASANVLSSKRGAGNDKGTGRQNQIPTIDELLEVSTPASSLSGRTRKGKEKEDTHVKTEETEPSRILRVRPSLPATVEVSKEPPPAREPPRGPDGKLLPICSTCSNVLPVISVDSQVVWGLDASGRKRKKQDCPRCLRHFAIYGQPWPCRVSPDGPVYLLPTPREEGTPVESASRRVNKKALSMLDRKLAAAAAIASTPSKSHKRQKEEEDGRPFKRRKTEPILRVETSKSQKDKHSKTGRHSLPGCKVLYTYGRHKRGRKPTSPSPSKSSDKDEDAESEVPAEAGQPVPKVRRQRKTATPQPTLSRAQRAEEREKVRRWLEKKDEEEAEEDIAGDPSGSARKRSSADLEDLEDHMKRKIARAKERQLPLQKVIPRPGSGFRGGQLFAKPNPLSYALHAWASPLLSAASSSSEDELPPDTPEDDVTVHLPSDTCVLARAPSIDFTFKPTPFSFARRRWGSSSTPPRDETKRRDLTDSTSQQDDASVSEEEHLTSSDELQTSLSIPNTDGFLRPPWYPNPIQGPNMSHVTVGYPTSISSLDRLSHSPADNDGSPAQRTVKRTPPSSPFLQDSDSSPLPILRRIISPASSPLSSLDSDLESSRDDKETLVKANVVRRTYSSVLFTSESVVPSLSLVQVDAEWGDSPLTSPIESDPDS